MNYKVICSDLDGTLLNSSSELSRENAEAISKMADQGIVFVPTTGRTVSEIPLSMLRENTFRYIIYSNGVGIYDRALGRSFDVKDLKKPLLERIFAVLDPYDTFTVLHSGRELYIDKEEFLNSKRFNLSDAYRYLFNNFSNAVSCGSIKEHSMNSSELESIVSFFSNENDIAECVERLSAIKEISVTSSAKGNIEIISHDAGKEKAMLRLSKRLGIPMESFIAVGDNGNDLGMICDAGLGLAVANAIDAVKNKCGRVICSNDEHIAKYILENIL